VLAQKYIQRSGQNSNKICQVFIDQVKNGSKCNKLILKFLPYGVVTYVAYPIKFNVIEKV